MDQTPGELDRMEYLADRFNRAIDMAHNRKDTQVFLAIDIAEELQQMLNDGLRTAKQIQQRGC